MVLHYTCFDQHVNINVNHVVLFNSSSDVISQILRFQYSRDGTESRGRPSERQVGRDARGAIKYHNIAIILKNDV